MLILKSIQLHNFRAVRDATFMPEETGTTALTGVSGSGKTSFLTGMLFCLYGDVPKGVTQKKLILDGEEECFVETCLEADGRDVKVRRELRAGNTILNMWIDGRQESVVSVKEGNVAVARALGITLPVLKTSFVVEQGAIDSLTSTSIGATKRRQAVESIVGLDVLMDALQESRDATNTVKRMIGAMGIPDGDREDIESELRVTKEEISTLEEVKPVDMNPFLDKYRSTSGEISTLESQLKIFRREQEAINQWREKVAEVNPHARERLAQAAEEGKKYSEQMPSREHQVSVENAVYKALSELKMAKANISTLEQKKSLYEAYKGLSVEMVDSEEITKAQDAVNAAMSSRSEAGAKLRQVESQYKELEEIPVGVCPTCQQQVSDSYRDTVLGAVKTLLEQAREEYNKAILVHSKANENLEILKEKDNESKKISHAIEELAEIESQIDSIMVTIPELEASVTEAESNRDAVFNVVSELEAKISQTREEWKKFNAEVQILNSKPEPTVVDPSRELAEKRQILQELELEREELNVLQGKYSLAQEKRGALLGKVSDLNNVLQAFDRADKAREELESLVGASELVDAYRTMTLDSLKPGMESFMSDMLSRVTNGEMVSVKLDNNFSPTITTVSGMEKTYGMLSGGEQAIVGLSMRLSLSKSQDGFLWCDEIGSAQDKERRESLMGVLSSLGEERQVILVSHMSGDLDTVDKNYTLVKNDDGSSTLTD